MPVGNNTRIGLGDKMNTHEERFYATAGKEVEEKRFSPAIHAKALADADGDEKKTTALYIRLRVKQLAAEHAIEQKTARRENKEEPWNSRPIGLKIFAVINFLFAVGLVLLLPLTYASLKGDSTIPHAYRILSPLITAALLVISGIGFLRVSYRAGFICGVLFCVLSREHHPLRLPARIRGLCVPYSKYDLPGDPIPHANIQIPCMFSG
jgi:hypothetical protein